MIRDEDLRSSLDYSEGQKEAAHDNLLMGFIRHNRSVQITNITRPEHKTDLLLFQYNLPQV